MAKTYVILGGAGGIGSQLARTLKQTGANLLIAGRQEEKLSALASELDCEYAVINAVSFDEVEKCFQNAVERFGQIDGAANCVGSLLLKPAHLTTEEDFWKTIQTNLGSAFACVKAAGKSMRGQGGSVVLVSSGAAHIGLANHESISAAKAGIEGLMLSAAATYARHKIRFNCVAPGLIETELTKSVTENSIARNSSLALHPLGRLGHAHDVAAAIGWLLSDESSWVSGQSIAVDGGLSTLKTAAASRG